MLSKNIKFPIFVIGTYAKLWSENNVLFLKSESGIIYKVDNKNLPYKKLSQRRFKIPKKERYNFIATFFNYAQLIKSGKKLFIDSEGKLFKYKKDRRVSLVYKEIIKRKNVEGKGFLLYVKGLTTPFTVSALIYNFEKYIGLLVIDDGYLIYEFSNEKKPNTWRKV